MQHLTEQTVVYSAKCDTQKSFDYILPEYLPGILRIIKASTSIEECTFNAGMAEPENNIRLKLCIMYISEYDGKIKSAAFRQEVSCTFKEPFTHTGEFTAVPSCFITSVQAIPQNQRKLTVKLSIQSGVTAYSETRTEIFSTDEKDGICAVKKTFPACTKTMLSETHFEKTEEISIDSTKSGIREIIRTDTCFTGAVAKASDAELGFEAKVNLRILYENANEDTDADTEYACLDTVISLCDTLHDERISEKDLPFLYIDVYSVEPSVSLDPYGENRLISLVIKYTVSGFTYRNDSFEAVTDAFIQGYSKDPCFEEFTIDSIHSTISNTEHISHSPHADLREITEISSCNAQIQSVSIEHSEGQFFASARCLAEILGTNLSGELSGFDMPVVLRIPLGGSELKPSDTIPDVLINIKSCSAQIKEGSLKTEFEIGTCGVFVSRTKHSLVCSLDCDDSSRIIKKNGEIVVYYPTKGEALWDIAKKYRTNPEKICLANKEDEESLCKKSAIIIP